MKEIRNRFIYSALGLSLMALSSAQAEKYEVEDLGKVDTGNFSVAYDINSLGQVVGSANLVTTYPTEDPEVDLNLETVQGFVVQPGGALANMGVLQPNLGEPPEDTEQVTALARGLNSQLFALNDSGLAVGYSDNVFAIPPVEGEEGGEGEEGEESVTTYAIQRYAVQYDGANLTQIPLPETATGTVATVINGSGVIMGYGNRPFEVDIEGEPAGTFNARRAWYYNPGAAEPFDWLPFPTDPDNVEDPLIRNTSTIAGINAANRAIGTADGFPGDDLNFDRAFYYDLGAAEVNALPMVTNRFHASAEKINDSNLVLVNEYNRFESTTGIFTFQSRGIIHDLVAETQVDIGVINPDEDHTVAKDINNSGTVVGFARVGERLNRDVYHAFIYDAENGIVDLNSKIDCDIGWELLDARAINNAGEIVGLGFYTFDNEDGESVTERRAFKLTLNTAEGVTPNTDCVIPNPFRSEGEEGGFLAPNSALALLMLGIFGSRRKRR